METHARVVVIGGGICGCSLLFHLTQLGWKDVILIERDELTSGSTWHAAGLNHLYAESPFLTRIAKESFDLYKSLEEATDASVGLHMCGGVRLANTKDGVKEFQRYLGPALANGVDAEIVDPHRVRELFPFLNKGDYLAGLHTPGEGYVDPSMTTNTLANNARREGASVYRQTSVTKLEQLAGGEWKITTTGGVVIAEFVVNCAGAWGAEISKLLGEYLPVLTQEHQYLVTESTNLVAGLEFELPVLRDPSVPFYCRQEGQSLMLSGFEDEVKFNWLDGAPSNFSMSLYPADLDRSASCLEKSFTMIPALRDLGIKAVVNGPIPATPDMQGLIGPAHGLKNYYVCCGIHGAFVQGYLTRYLAEWIVYGEPSIDLATVDVRRFGGYATQKFAVSKVSAAHTMFSLPANYPNVESEGGRRTRVGPLYETLGRKGAVFGVIDGWEVANWFAPKGVDRQDIWSFERTNWFEYVAMEVRWARENAALMDLTPVSKHSLVGPSVESLLSQLSATELPRIGERRVCAFLSEKGRLELVVKIDRLSADHYCLYATSDLERRVTDCLNRRSVKNLKMNIMTDDQSLLLLVGPLATQILESCTGLDLEGVPPLTFVKVSIAGSPVRLVRVNDIDACAWELHHIKKYQIAIYSNLIKEHMVSDFGMRAYESMRLERGIAKFGIDFTLETSLASNALSHLVGLQNPGSQCTRAVVGDSSDYKLVYLTFDDHTIPIDPSGGEIIEVQGQSVGMVTSGGYAYGATKTVAFAHIQSHHSELGSQVQVRLLDRHFCARVTNAPLQGQTGVM